MLQSGKMRVFVNNANDASYQTKKRGEQERMPDVNSVHLYMYVS